jgi:sugar lactone lactonase YvrE
MLSSGGDGQLIFVQDPGMRDESVSFLQLTDSTGKAVSGLDDAVWTLTPKGTFYVSDTNNNRVLKVEVSNLAPSSLYASVGNLNTVGNVDLDTGVVRPFITNVNAPHGLIFVPDFKSLFAK